MRLIENITEVFRHPRRSWVEDGIVILGRGASLARLTDFSENIQRVLLVNAFWDNLNDKIPYYQDSIIHNFIKDKELILVCNPGEDRKDIKRFLKRYKTKARFQTSFDKVVRVKTPKKYFRNFPNEVIIPFQHLQENFHYVGSLGAAILLCKYKYRIKKFFIFGLDFFEHGYYLNHMDYYNNPESDYASVMEYSDLTKDTWTKFMEYHSDCQFNVYTYANFEGKDNIFVYR